MNPTPTTSAEAHQTAAPHAPLPAAQDSHAVPVLPSSELLRGQKAVAIDHNGSLYRLQTTRQGKLILTK
jgi:hemin uptake protein HemP